MNVLTFFYSVSSLGAFTKWKRKDMAETEFRQELTILESKIRHLERELHDIKSRNQNAAWKSENYIYYEGNKYICANFVQNRKCLYRNVVRMPGFDVCTNINGKICRLLTKID